MLGVPESELRCEFFLLQLRGTTYAITTIVDLATVASYDVASIDTA